MSLIPFAVFASLLACSGGDPALRAQHEAIEAWNAGVAALDAGDPERAQAQFKLAQAARPRDGLLLAWEARAAAAQGRPDEAITLLEAGLAMQPGMSEARYNLAAALARAGRMDEAALHLVRALDDGAATPREVVADPDFAGALADPAFAFLPAAPLEAALELPSGAVFWGSQATISLLVQGSEHPVLQGRITGPVELVSGLAERRGVGAEASLRTEWTVRAIAAGTVEVGPFTVRSGGREITLKRRQFEATAPPDKPALDPVATELESIEALADGLELPGIAGGSAVRARATSAQKVTVEPAGGRTQRFEWREEGRASWVLHRWVDLRAGSYEVVVRNPGAEALRRVVEVTAIATPPG